MLGLSTGIGRGRRENRIRGPFYQERERDMNMDMVIRRPGNWELGIRDSGQVRGTRAREIGHLSFVSFQKRNLWGERGRK